jgi:hypothetical protein
MHVHRCTRTVIKLIKLTSYRAVRTDRVSVLRITDACVPFDSKRQPVSTSLIEYPNLSPSVCSSPVMHVSVHDMFHPRIRMSLSHLFMYTALVCPCTVTVLFCVFVCIASHFTCIVMLVRCVLVVFWQIHDVC